MNEYKITAETLKDTPCGYQTEVSEKVITLTDLQEATLMRIMEDACGKGEDLYELDLSETDLIYYDVELYDLIEKAYFDCSYDPYFEDMVKRAYDRNDPVGVIMDWRQVRNICAERYGYVSGGNEDITTDQFYGWFEENIINPGRLVEFEREENLMDIDKSEYEFRAYPRIPEDLVDKFLRTLPAISCVHP